MPRQEMWNENRHFSVRRSDLELALAPPQGIDAK
jgi:hypothetical protein